MRWLPLTHLLALALLAYHPFFWIRRDAAAIAADGSADTLHEAFHARRLGWRVAFTLLVCAAASLPAVGHRWAGSVSLAGLLALGAAWFAYVFNPGLSRARGLPTYYVSFEARAARFPDRWLARRAARRYPMPGADGQPLGPFTLARRRADAAAALKELLLAALALGMAAYLGSLLALICSLY